MYKRQVQEPLFAAHAVCHLNEVKAALADKNRFTIVQCAPAVRVAIAEEFGAELGTLTPGKLSAALHALGFDRVYDTNFPADVTIMEEGKELVKRVTEGGVLPMFTSCCPAWVLSLIHIFRPRFSLMIKVSMGHINAPILVMTLPKAST